MAKCPLAFIDDLAVASIVTWPCLISRSADNIDNELSAGGDDAGRGSAAGGWSGDRCEEIRPSQNALPPKFAYRLAWERRHALYRDDFDDCPGNYLVAAHRYRRGNADEPSCYRARAFTVDSPISTSAGIDFQGRSGQNTTTRVASRSSICGTLSNRGEDIAKTAGMDD